MNVIEWLSFAAILDLLGLRPGFGIPLSTGLVLELNSILLVNFVSVMSWRLSPRCVARVRFLVTEPSCLEGLASISNVFLISNLCEDVTRSIEGLDCLDKRVDGGLGWSHQLPRSGRVHAGLGGHNFLGYDSHPSSLWAIKYFQDPNENFPGDSLCQQLPSLLGSMWTVHS